MKNHKSKGLFRSFALALVVSGLLTVLLVVFNRNQMDAALFLFYLLFGGVPWLIHGVLYAAYPDQVFNIQVYYRWAIYPGFFAVHFLLMTPFFWLTRKKGVPGFIVILAAYVALNGVAAGVVISGMAP